MMFERPRVMVNFFNFSRMCVNVGSSVACYDVQKASAHGQDADGRMCALVVAHDGFFVSHIMDVFVVCQNLFQFQRIGRYSCPIGCEWKISGSGLGVWKRVALVVAHDGFFVLYIMDFL